MNIKDLKNLVREVLLEQTREQQYQSILAKIERINSKMEDADEDSEHYRDLLRSKERLELEAERQNPEKFVKDPEILQKLGKDPRFGAFVPKSQVSPSKGDRERKQAADMRAGTPSGREGNKKRAQRIAASNAGDISSSPAPRNPSKKAVPSSEEASSISPSGSSNDPDFYFDASGKRVFTGTTGRGDLGDAPGYSIRENKNVSLKSTLKELYEQDEKQATSSSGAKRKLVFLIGPPAVGKSTWLNTKASSLYGDYVQISNDDTVDEVLKSMKDEGQDLGGYDVYMIKPPNLFDLVKSKTEIPTRKEINEEPNSVKVTNYLQTIKDIANGKEWKEYTKDPIYKIQSLQSFEKSDEKKTIEEKSEEKFFYNLINQGIRAYTLEDIKKLSWIPIEKMSPFTWKDEKMSAAQERVGKEFSSKRKKAATGGQNIIIDMLNDTRASRDQHRKVIAEALGITDVSEKFEQIAHVFAIDPSKTGVSPDKVFEAMSQQLEKLFTDISSTRNIERRKQGLGGKTIPKFVYDRFTKYDKNAGKMNYDPPTPEEGFSRIEYVGMPSLGINGKGEITSPSAVQEGINPRRWQKLAKIIKD